MASKAGPGKKRAKKVVRKTSKRPLGRQSDAKWELRLLEAGCLRLEPLGTQPLSYLAYRFGFRPIALGDVIEEAPPSRYLLSVDLAPQPDTSKQKIQLLDVLALGALDPAGAVDRSHVGKAMANLGVGLGGAAAPLAAAALGLPWAALPGALLASGGALAGAFLGKQALSPAVPVVLSERAFGWRYAATESMATPWGILEGGALLRLERSIRFLNVNAQVKKSARGRLCAKRFRVPVKDAPVVEETP